MIKTSNIIAGLLIAICIITVGFFVINTDYTKLIFDNTNKQQTNTQTINIPDNNIEHKHIINETENINKQESYSINNDYYVFIDKKGITHLTNNKNNIPIEYKKNVKTYKEDNKTIKVQIINNQILVPVTLQNNGNTVNCILLLDTGCNITTISDEIANKLNINRLKIKQGTSRIAGGYTVPNQTTNIEKINIENWKKEGLKVSIMQHTGTAENHEGLLGMNFLKDFQYQIDYKNSSLRLK